MKPEAEEGAFQKDNLDFFHSSEWMLLGAKVFMITDILRKMCWKQKPGTVYR